MEQNLLCKIYFRDFILLDFLNTWREIFLFLFLSLFPDPRENKSTFTPQFLIGVEFCRTQVLQEAKLRSAFEGIYFKAVQILLRKLPLTKQIQANLSKFHIDSQDITGYN